MRSHLNFDKKLQISKHFVDCREVSKPLVLVNDLETLVMYQLTVRSLTLESKSESSKPFMIQARKLLHIFIKIKT